MSMQRQTLVFLGLSIVTAAVACGPQSLTDSAFIPIGVTPPEASDSANVLNASNELTNVVAANQAVVTSDLVSLAKSDSRRPASHANPDSSMAGGTSANTSSSGTAAANANTATDSNTSNSAASNADEGGTAYDLSTLLQEVWPAHQFNDEQQRYTDNNQNVSFAKDGTATIVARPTGGTGWTSARLSGPTLKETGGIPQYVEATITLPTGKGSWPAFWLTSRGSWPQGSEVDITEVVNGVDQSHISTHWGPQTGNATFNTHEIIQNVDVSKSHRYGAFITNSGVQFYLDGQKVGKEVTMPAASNFSSLAPKLVPIVNLAMGGTFPGDAPQSTGAQTMVVHSITHSKKPPA